MLSHCELHIMSLSYIFHLPRSTDCLHNVEQVGISLFGLALTYVNLAAVGTSSEVPGSTQGSERPTRTQPGQTRDPARVTRGYRKAELELDYKYVHFFLQIYDNTLGNITCIVWEPSVIWVMKQRVCSWCGRGWGSHNKFYLTILSYYPHTLWILPDWVKPSCLVKDD